MNPYLNKPVEEIKYSSEAQKQNHPVLFIDNNRIVLGTPLECFIVILDPQLDSREHLKATIDKVNKTTVFMKNLYFCKTLITNHLQIVCIVCLQQWI